MESYLALSLAIIVLLIISGFLAGAETAITGISQATIHRLKQEGNKQAHMVSTLRLDKEKLVSALLLCNIGCNIYISKLCTVLIVLIFGEKASSYTTIIETILIFVLAEMLPKTYAFEKTEKYALTTAPILIMLVRVLYPIISFVQVIVDFILSKVTTKIDKNSLISANEELRGAIELHHHEGTMIKDDRDMLGSILDLANTDVTTVMVHRSNITSIDVDLPILSIMQQALESGYTRLPIWQDTSDNIIGILNIKDLLKEVHSSKGNLNEINVTKILTTPWFVPETTMLNEQLHEFRIKRNHFALVINEYGDLLGLITLEDILEVIVGRIDDEHDLIVAGIIKNLDGTYFIEGTVNIRDINRELDWNLPTEESSTVAGLIMHQTEKVPELGEIFELFDTKFTISDKHYNQIKMVHAERLQKNKV